MTKVNKIIFMQMNTTYSLKYAVYVPNTNDVSVQWWVSV